MRFDDNMDDTRGVGGGGSANSSSDFVSPSSRCAILDVKMCSRPARFGNSTSTNPSTRPSLKAGARRMLILF